MAIGLLGYKLGMTQIYREDGTRQAVTAIAAGPCLVTQIRTRERDGYTAVQLGFGMSKRLNAPELGHLKGLSPFKHLLEFRAEDVSAYKVGQQVDLGLFKPGDLVDIVGTSKGRGFAGVVKRHHFAGGPKTHGQSDRHRAPGSIGSTTTPGRVFKGLRMAGHMGNQQVTVKNVEVVSIDQGRNLLLIKGAVPGSNKGLIIIHRVERR